MKPDANGIPVHGVASYGRYIIQNEGFSRSGVVWSLLLSMCPSCNDNSFDEGSRP